MNVTIPIINAGKRVGQLLVSEEMAEEISSVALKTRSRLILVPRIWSGESASRLAEFELQWEPEKSE